MTHFWILIQFLICASVLYANILPNPQHKLQVLFQSRTQVGYQFNRSFVEFEDGFTSPDGTGYWLGLKQLHNLTSSFEWNMVSTFQSNKDGIWYWTELSNFKVGPGPKYQITFEGSVAGNFDVTLEYWNTINESSFSAFDKDEDEYDENCAEKEKGGWWYSHCGKVRPNSHFGHFWGGHYSNTTSFRLVRSTISDLTAPEPNCPKQECPKPVCPKQSDDDFVNKFHDMDVITFQSRKKLDVSFANKSFEEYKNGFGLIGRSDFWLGLEELHNLTQSREYNLLAFFKVDKYKKWLWVEISNFKVGAGPEYTLSIGDRVDGNFDEQLTNWINQSSFSVIEHDKNDQEPSNCMNAFGRGGWWYGSAFMKVNPNYCLLFVHESSGNQEVLEVSASVMKIKEIN